MTLTINDVEDFVDILKEYPEWRRRIVQVLFNGNEPASRDAIDRLAEQVRLLTEQVRLLTERMDRFEQRFDRLEQREDHLEQRVEEGFNQVNERIDQLEQRTNERFNQVDERFNQVDERFNQVDERFNQVDERFNQVDRNIQKLTDQVGSMRGETLELRYRNHVGAYFGRVLRRMNVVEIRSLEDELETHLSDEAFEQLLNLDLLAKGKVKNHPNHPEVWIAIEVSATVRTNDVTRARQRADILCQAGYPTIAVAGGEECSLDAIALAQQTNVVIIQDGGQMTGWDAAFAIISPMITE